MFQAKKHFQQALIALSLSGLVIVGAGCVEAGTDASAVETGVAAVKESLEVKGSDTSVQLVANMAEAFNASDSSSVAVTGGGSGVGIAALMNREIELANSSRPVTEEERTKAADRGLDLHEFIIARDGLSMVVHPANPINSLTVEQVSGIYRGQIRNWKEVGGQDATISLYGRQSTSGTYAFSREVAVKGDYDPAMRNMEGNQAIAEAISLDANGIGYIGVGYAKDENGNARSGIKILPLGLPDGRQASPLDEQAVLSGEYPLARPIYQYLAVIPAKGSLIDRFLRFEISDQGQKISEQAGFFRPAAPDMAANQALLDKIK